MSEPVAWRISGRFGWTYQDDPPYESQRGRVAEPLYQHPQADHREALESSKASDAESIAMYRRCRDDRDKLREIMRQAIEALRDAHAYSVMHEEFRGGVLDVIDALRKALASDAMDRLAQADRELGLGERA
jgi:hypothetical protein